MMMRGFHASLSDKTVYMRYLSPMMLSARITHERLARMTHNDYDREIALVVEGHEQDERAILGVARLSKLRGTNEDARFTMLISDRFQGQGLGKELTKRIIEIGRNEKIKNIIAIMSPENEAMQKLCRSVGFTSFDIEPDTNMLKAQITL
jgi:acetyltransferase